MKSKPNQLTNWRSLLARASRNDTWAPGSGPGVDLIKQVLLIWSRHCLMRYDLGIPSMAMLSSWIKASPTANLFIRNSTVSTFSFASGGRLLYCFQFWWRCGVWVEAVDVWGAVGEGSEKLAGASWIIDECGVTGGVMVPVAGVCGGWSVKWPFGVSGGCVTTNCFLGGGSWRVWRRWWWCLGVEAHSVFLAFNPGQNCWHIPPPPIQCWSTLSSGRNSLVGLLIAEPTLNRGEGVRKKIVLGSCGGNTMCMTDDISKNGQN